MIRGDQGYWGYWGYQGYISLVVSNLRMINLITLITLIVLITLYIYRERVREIPPALQSATCSLPVCLISVQNIRSVSCFAVINKPLFVKSWLEWNVTVLQKCANLVKQSRNKIYSHEPSRYKSGLYLPNSSAVGILSDPAEKKAAFWRGDHVLYSPLRSTYIGLPGLLGLSALF